MTKKHKDGLLLKQSRKDSVSSLNGSLPWERSIGHEINKLNQKFQAICHKFMKNLWNGVENAVTSWFNKSKLERIVY